MFRAARTIRPSGGAVDIVVVKQKDGGFKCSPWYVKFGRFQGLLRRKERILGISVNDVESDFQMYLNNKGGVHFLQSPSNDSNDPQETIAGGGFVRRGLSGRRWFLRRKLQTITPTPQQLASLNLKHGRNKVTFTFMSGVLGKRQIDAGIYLLDWSSKIVVSDVDGTITRSDVLGQVMPLLGRDWSQRGVTSLFSAIKENGYELIFLSARAISQAYRTRNFLMNLEQVWEKQWNCLKSRVFDYSQDGVKLPEGPVVISPDGIVPSLYREVIKRMPQEFKIACLQELRSLFPPDCNPFYAGFGNRDTDVISYLHVGIPKGKIFTINPQGELVASTALDVRCYASLEKLVHEMFPRLT